MNEQKPTNAELLVMIVALTDLVVTAIKESRTLHRYDNENEEADEVEESIRETGRLAEQMRDLILKTLDSIESDYKQTNEKERQ